jgi:hypothetical protein
MVRAEREQLPGDVKVDEALVEVVLSMAVSPAAAPTSALSLLLSR